MSTRRRRRSKKKRFAAWLNTIPGLIRYPAPGRDGETVRRALVDGADDSTFDADIVGATVAQPFSRGLPYADSFDGNNDSIKIYSTALNAVFNGAEGSFFAFAQVNSVATWADGVAREIVIFNVDADNSLQIFKPTLTNRLQIRYESGAIAYTKTISTTTLDPFMICVTWSETRDKLIVYFDGIEQSVTNSLGEWAGALSATTTTLGSLGNINYWHGPISDAVVAIRALTSNEVMEIYRRWGG